MLSGNLASTMLMQNMNMEHEHVRVGMLANQIRYVMIVATQPLLVSVSRL